MKGVTEFTENDIATIEKEILHSDYDFVGVISGGEGMGKSTLTKRINEIANKKSVGKYVLERDTIFYPTMEDVDRMYQPENKYQSKQWDEAIRLLYKLDWACKKSKAIVKDFAVNRQLNMGTWLCIPRMQDLNENFRNWRVDWWGYVLERGLCVWYAKDWSPFARDPWHWAENEKIIRKWQRKSNVNTSKILNILSKTIGFQGITYFDKYPDGDPGWEKYLELKASKKTSLIEKVHTDNKIHKTIIELHNRNFIQNEIAEIVGVGQSTVSKVIKESNIRSVSSNNSTVQEAIPVMLKG